MKVVSLLSALAAVCLPFLSLGEEGKAGFNDGVNRDDPKFVTASLAVVHVALISGDGLFKIMRCRNNSAVV